MEVQDLRHPQERDTRKALRFFAERRIKTHFVDLQERAALLGERRRFADLGLGAARLPEDRWLEKLAKEPLLLRMPLVRQQQRLTISDAEATWREWASR